MHCALFAHTNPRTNVISLTSKRIYHGNFENTGCSENMITKICDKDTIEQTSGGPSNENDPHNTGMRSKTEQGTKTNAEFISFSKLEGVGPMFRK